MVMVLGLACAAGNAWPQVPVPTDGCYHSAFTPNYPAGGAYGHADFESLAQKKIAIEMFYTGWPTNRVADFPASQCDAIVALGSVPHITWEPWVSGVPYNLDGIIDGLFDSYLTGYASQVRTWGRPLFIRLGHEMNGNWYPWDGTHNGGSTLDGFGDPARADGPERFVAAFRHVRHLFDSLGVKNVSWVWAPNNYSTPYEDWNQPENYYPGDDAVDWIGLDGYNWGSSQTWSNWSSFYDTFREIYDRFKTKPQPMMIAEFASTELGGSKSQWIRDVFLYTKAIFKRVKAITWFNINKETDWRINSSALALAAYQQSVADAYFLSSVPVVGVLSDAPQKVDFQFDAPSPNPANGVVRLSFRLPAQAEYSLRIYNLLGQEVRELSRGTADRGEHVSTWDTRDNGGNIVGSGFYIAVLQTERHRGVQKVIIVK